MTKENKMKIRSVGAVEVCGKQDCLPCRMKALLSMAEVLMEDVTVMDGVTREQSMAFDVALAAAYALNKLKMSDAGKIGVFKAAMSMVEMMTAATERDKRPH